MDQHQKHLINENESVKDALTKLNLLAADAILFVVESNDRLIGSLTDGDLRRGFLKGLHFESHLSEFIQQNPISITLNSYSLEQLEAYKKNNYRIIPILDDKGVLVDIINFRLQSTIIPADAVLMAGGKGKRLMPLTAQTPKPLLKVGDQPIIEYNIDRLIQVGIKNIHLSINYLGHQIQEYFGDGSSKHVSINYVKEEKPLGTVGSVLLVNNFKHDDILVMNSDLLTNIDFADFYRSFKNSDADMAVATTSYHVDVPYAVLEVDTGNAVQSLIEKPRYTYYSNAGIYLLKRKVLNIIPPDEFYDITDLMEALISQKRNIVSYPITGYWLDIGSLQDYKKAQEDIKYIKL